MTFEETSNHYEVLDIPPDASPQEVRSAYLRVKSAYSKDSLAMYTLVSTDERNEILKKIEEAYDILSSPEKRKKYDLGYGSLGSNMGEDSLEPFARVRNKVVSIDRVPPMETISDSEALLIPPSTDFDSPGGSHHKDFTEVSSQSGATLLGPSTTNPLASAQGPSSKVPDSPLNSPSTYHGGPPTLNPPQLPRSSSSTRIPSPGKMAPEADSLQELSTEIETEKDFRGIFIRKIREARKISIEEMSNMTKISKTYLAAIEEENFSKLPAAVYVRGFVIQVSRILKLPFQKVSVAYMGRFAQANPDK